jgi:hypothetical protein
MGSESKTVVMNPERTSLFLMKYKTRDDESKREAERLRDELIRAGHQAIAYPDCIVSLDHVTERPLA